MEQQTFSTARVITHYRSKYRVADKNGEYWAEVAGKMMFTAASQADYPVVGDFVRISKLEDDHSVIHEILPRKTLIQRKAAGKDEDQPIAANIDTAFVVQAVDRDFNLNRFERYLSMAAAGKIKPAIVLNKIDLISEEELAEKTSQIKARFNDIDILTTSTTRGDGMEQLYAAIEKQKTYCLLGSSGVGKSSIINKLLGKKVLKTKNISVSTKKGKHVTTHRELFKLKNGAFIIDTPGMREVGMNGAAAGIADVFSKISQLAEECRFSDCTHSHEAGCAVREAVASGELDEAKYLNYLKLKKESDYHAMTSLEKRRKDRAFGKMVHKALKTKKSSK